jgi:L-2,4-diaminobutyrate decarboxylase
MLAAALRADKLYGGADAVGMLSDYVMSATNTNVHAYGTSPLYATVEVAVLHRMRELFGLPVAEGDGIFGPGGSYCNLLAMLAARERAVAANGKVHRVT